MMAALTLAVIAELSTNWPGLSLVLVWAQAASGENAANVASMIAVLMLLFMMFSSGMQGDMPNAG
jgi:hypothetical protein